MNQITLRKVVVFILIFLGVLIVATYATHAFADDGGVNPNQVMAPLDQGWETESEDDLSFDNTWWCQESGCEVDYDLLYDPPDDPPPSDPGSDDPPPAHPGPEDPPNCEDYWMGINLDPWPGGCRMFP